MTAFHGWQIPQADAHTLSRLPNLISQLKIRLHTIEERFSQAKFASSLAVEDMVITDIIVKEQLSIKIFTLDTGRLNQETLALIQQIQQHYAIKLEIMQPVAHSVSQFQDQHGDYPFYQSTELRKQCCYIRKIEPLKRALSNANCWITGQRKAQSMTRTDLEFEEYDQANQLTKFNPIFDWSEQEVWAYCLQNKLPINPLYFKHYPSIGCEPCTKPIRQGEDIRAGRWWWENAQTKECGLHNANH